LCELKNDYKKAKDFYVNGLIIESSPSDLRSLNAMVNLKSHYSILLSMMGFPAQAELISDQASNESKLINRLSGKVQAHAAKAIAQFYGGKYKQSLQTALMVYKLAEQLNLSWWVSLLDLLIARDYLVMGQLDETWQHLHHSIENKEPFLATKIYQYYYAVIGDIYRLLGNATSAEVHFHMGILEPNLDVQSLENYFSLGLALCQRQEWAEGIAIVKKAVDNAEGLGLESISLPGKVVLAAITNPDITNEQFALQTTPIISEMRTRGFGNAEMTCAVIAGGISLRRREMSKAKEYLQMALEMSQSLNHSWNELWALSALTSQFEDKVEQQYHEQKSQLLNNIAAHSKTKPVAELFTKFKQSL
jgi:tetratricopeptide (TPR) repeat protein